MGFINKYRIRSLTGFISAQLSKNRMAALILKFSYHEQNNTGQMPQIELPHRQLYNAKNHNVMGRVGKVGPPFPLSNAGRGATFNPFSAKILA